MSDAIGVVIVSLPPELQILIAPSLSSTALVLSGTIWHRVGPYELVGSAPGSTNYQSGDMVQLSVDPDDNNTIYASSLDGGLWRLPYVSNYPSTSWTPLSDSQLTLRTCSFAVAANNNNNIIYLADGLGRILRSVNRGHDWSESGPARFNYVNKILVHPLHSNVVYVASDRSRMFDFMGQAGFWKSIDSGQSWRQISTGEVSDAVMDPASPDIIYIGIRGQGILKTSNADADWDKIQWATIFPFSEVTIPPGVGDLEGTTIKIVLGHVGNDSNRLVAVKFHRQLFINNSGGRNTAGQYDPWERQTWDTKPELGQNGDDQSSKNNVIAVDPFDNNILLTGHQDLYLTDDGGANGNLSWYEVAGYARPDLPVHVDQNYIAFDPSKSGVAYLANDGGIYRSTDSGRSWSELNRGLFTTQITGGAAVAHNTVLASVYHQGLCGSDNASSDTATWIALTGGSWESSKVFADPMRPNVFYIFQGPTIQRLNYPQPFTAIANFTPSAIAVHPTPGSNILIAASTAPTTLWRTSHGDLDNPDWLAEQIDNSVNPLVSNEQIVSIAFAPSNRLMAYMLTDTGKVFRKDDVTSSQAWIYRGTCNSTTTAKQIVVNPMHEDRIFVVSDTQIFHSIDGGGSLPEIRGSGNRSIPANTKLVSLIGHPESSGTLYLAALVGIFVSYTEGAYWDRYDSGLPNVVISSLALDRYLYVGTMGRGVWKTRSTPWFFPTPLPT